MYKCTQCKREFEEIPATFICEHCEGIVIKITPKQMKRKAFILGFLTGIVLGIIAGGMVTALIIEREVNEFYYTYYGDPEYSVDKPVIYIYPEKETEVKVTIELEDSSIITSYPKYSNGWEVTAHPNGKLIDKDNKEYDYLYWESTSNKNWDFSEGFCVAGKDSATFLEDKLDTLGLNRSEINDFITYWLPQLEANNFNLITFQTEKYTQYAELNITPEPETTIRVFMAWKPLEKPVNIVNPELTAVDRSGYTVVEWGGTKVE